MRQERKHGLMQAVEEPDIERDDLYLLLDSAALPALQIIYQHDDEPHLELLYRGTRHESMRECSPVLYSLAGQHLMWKNRERWQSAGLLLESAASIDDLANHLRSLLSVRLPSGDLAFCRFYDPALSERFFDRAGRLARPDQRHLADHRAERMARFHQKPDFSRQNC